jgi:transposase
LEGSNKHLKKRILHAKLQLTDALWSRLQPDLIACGIYATEDLRDAVEGILYKLRTGTPWRDLPAEFGAWNTAFKRFNSWCKKGKLKILFKKLAADPDHEWTFVDGTIVKAHQHSSGAAKGAETAIGKHVAGNTTKIHLAVDAFGLPIEFELTGGQVHDVKTAPTMVEMLPDLENFIADKGYDSDELRMKIELAGATSNIPRTNNSNTVNAHMD